MKEMESVSQLPSQTDIDNAKGRELKTEKGVESENETREVSTAHSEETNRDDNEDDSQGGGSLESEDSSEGTVVTKVKYRTWQNTSSESWESGNPISPIEAEELENKALERAGHVVTKTEENSESKGEMPRPESFSLPKSQPHYEKKRSQSDGVAIECYNNLANVPRKKDSEFENIEETMLSKSMPQGVVTKKGELFEFIADDLQEKIRQSSPLPGNAGFIL